MAASGESNKMKAVKRLIRSVVISEKDGVFDARFLDDYEKYTMERLDYKGLGFDSVRALMESIPDVVSIKTFRGQVLYEAIPDETTQHLHNLIKKQKSNKKNVPPTQKTRKPHSPALTHHGSSQRTRGSSRPPLLSTPTHSSYTTRPNRFQSSYPKAHRTPPRRFSSQAVSPLMVTVRGSDPHGDDRRWIERGIKDSSRQPAHPPRNSYGGVSARTYEVPPRFQKQRGKPPRGDNKMLDNFVVTAGGDNDLYSRVVQQPDQRNHSPDRSSVNSEENYNRTKAVTRNPKDELYRNGASLDESRLPPNAKAWFKQTLQNSQGGVWTSKVFTLFKEEFQTEVPKNIMDILETWHDVVRVEWHAVANKAVLHAVVAETPVWREPAQYPAARQPASVSKHSQSVAEKIATIRSESDHATRQSVIEAQPSQQQQNRPLQWKNYNIDYSRLLSLNTPEKMLISCLKDPHHFHIRENTKDLRDLKGALFSLEENGACPKMSDLEPGVFCAAVNRKKWKNWCRARIMRVSSENDIFVVFVDYGNMDKVSLSEIRCLSEETSKLPAQSMECSLHSVVPLEGIDSWSDKAMDAMLQLNGRLVTVSAISVQSGICWVDLWTDDPDGESFSEKLIREKAVDRRDPKSEYSEDLELELPEEDYMEVVVAFVDLTQCWLRIIGPDYSEKLDVFEDQLAALFKKSEAEPDTLEVGSVCIAFADCLYHRVQIREIRESQANCFFVDHGYTEWFSLNDLSPLDEEVNQTLAYQAVQCILLGLDNYMSYPTTITELVEKSKERICVAEIILKDPLTVILFDTHGNEDININQEIALKLQAEGQPIDMTLFATDLDTISEDSGNDTRVVVSNTDQSLNASTEEAGEATLDGKDAGKGKSSPPLSTSSSPGHHSPPASAALDSGKMSARPSSLQGPREETPYSGSLCVAYNTWPLPSYLPTPKVGDLFDVYVLTVINPSNFVIVPLDMLGQLENMMQKMNSYFMTGSPDQEAVAPTVVPTPLGNHLYMVQQGGAYYRALYVSTNVSMHQVFLPDYCLHSLVPVDQLFFLPKVFWGLPFFAHRACLHGVKPGGEKSKRYWTEAVKYKFQELVHNKTLVGLLKAVVEGGDDGDILPECQDKLSVHLIDTSLPDVDIIVTDALLAACVGVQYSES